MIRTRALGAIGIMLAGAVVLPAASLPENSPSTATAAHRAAFDQNTFWQTTKVYCDTCHFGPKARAKLNLESLDLSNLGSNGETWEKILRKLRNREMPPAGMPRPDEATYDALIKFVESGRDRLAEVKPNPGRATLHRLPPECPQPLTP